LTNGFSKKAENRPAAIALHFTYYKFGRIHQMLRVTHAMEPGVASTYGSSRFFRRQTKGSSRDRWRYIGRTIDHAAPPPPRLDYAMLAEAREALRMSALARIALREEIIRTRELVALVRLERMNRARISAVLAL
jgi:hypothetical protein